MRCPDLGMFALWSVRFTPLTVRFAFRLVRFTPSTVFGLARFAQPTVEERQLSLALGQGVPEGAAAVQPQGGERPGLGQPGCHGSAEPGSPREIVDRREGSSAADLFDLPGVCLGHALNHVEAEAERKGRMKDEG